MLWIGQNPFLVQSHLRLQGASFERRFVFQGSCMKKAFLQSVLFGGSTAAQRYDARVLATSPLRYNKLNETSGTTIVDSSTNAYTGTYTGVDLANTDSPFLPEKAPFWDGTNDYGNLYSAAFGTAMNLDEFTVMVWIKVSGAGVWTDGVARNFFDIERLVFNNEVQIQKLTTNNTVRFRRDGAGVTKLVDVAGFSETTWFCLAISASVAGGGLLTAGDLRAYKNGVQVGTTQTGNIASTGSGLNSASVVLGASSTTPTNVHSGYLSRFIIWNRPIDAAILALMTA